MPTLQVAGSPGTPIYAGRAAPGGSLLTTLTLVNTSGSEQAANFVSPMFGQPFKQGDVPSGEYPKWELTDGTPCPATVWGVTTWPDGSMKFCAAMIRVPTTIAGSGFLTINVKNGESAPGLSARDLSDSTAADLSVELTGVTNLTGTWTATLADAIANGTAVEIGDGPAGAYYRVLGDFKQGGTPHGHAVCWHYLQVLENASGGLYGIRYLGRVHQPWTDVASPQRLEVGCSLKSGASTVRSLLGRNLDVGAAPGTTIGLPHLAGFYTAGSDAKYDFFQSGGSASADCTVRVQHDPVYWKSTQMFRAQKLDITPGPYPSHDYFPNCKGEALTYFTGTTGPRAEIGTMPLWAARHLITQSATDERIVRVTGLAQSGYRTGVRKASTGNVVACIDPSPSYTGLGTIETGWRYWDAGSASGGFQLAPSNTHIWSGEMESHHRGAFSYYAYMLTGEFQYLDQMVEVAAMTILCSYTNTATYNTTSPVTVSTITNSGFSGERRGVIGSTTYKSGGIFTYGGLVRFAAWSSRDVGQAAGVYPDVCPFGSETRKYLREVLDQAYQEQLAYKDARSTDWRDSGILTFNADANGGLNGWCAAYLSESVCNQVAINPTANGVAFRQYLSKFWKNIYDTQAIGAVGAFYALMFDDGGNQVERVQDIAYAYSNATFTFSTSTSRCTIGGANGLWSPTNGDMFAFIDFADSDKPFAAAVNRKRFYAVNCSGQTFQLAETPGGSPITVTSNVVISEWGARIANQSPNYSFQNAGTDVEYFSWVTSAVTNHVACGDSDLSAVQANMAATNVSQGIDLDGSIFFASTPTFAS